MDRSNWIPRFVTATLALTLFVPGLSAQEADTAEAQTPKGFYTEAQADRGEEAFAESCGYCHSPSEFSGSSFMQNWSGAPVGQLYGLISSTMPMDAPGMLPMQEYTDIIAYILQMNDLPADATELPADRQALSEIVIENTSGGDSRQR